MEKRWRYQFRRRFLSGALHQEYFAATLLSFMLALHAFQWKGAIPFNDFVWQALLGIFTGLLVGYIVDAVEGWYKTRFLSLILAPLQVEKTLPVVVATLSGGQCCVELNGGSGTHRHERYKVTGPGETRALGLLYGAYTTLFSTASKAVTGEKISVIPSSTIDLDTEGFENFSGQRIILGGPRYNELTRQVLEWGKLEIHYAKEGEMIKGQLELKDKKEPPWDGDSNPHSDFGLIVKRGRQLHASGCRTWGVIGAATFLFTERAAEQLVAALKKEDIDPISDDYYAVISCDVPDQKEEYSIGESKVVRVKKIDGV